VWDRPPRRLGWLCSMMGPGFHPAQGYNATRSTPVRPSLRYTVERANPTCLAAAVGDSPACTSFSAAATGLLALPRDHMRFLINKLVNVPITSLATCLCRARGIATVRARVPSRMSVAKPCTIAQQAMEIVSLTADG
jgi:hypothetical protein